MNLRDIFETKENMKSLYVSRPVLNKDAIRLWAKDNGFASCLPPSDFHVTLIYSKKMFDWDKSDPDSNIIYVDPSDEHRSIEQFGSDAVVLEIQSDALQTRWKELIDLGAHSSFPTYRSHITITYEGMPSEVVPYNGEIVLGPEIWEEIVEDYNHEDTVELKLSIESDTGSANQMD